LCGHPDGERRSRAFRSVARRRSEHVLQSREALLRGTTNAPRILVARGVGGRRGPRHSRRKSRTRLDRRYVGTLVKEPSWLPARRRKLGGGWLRPVHPITQRCSGAVGDDAVFALAVRQVVRGGGAASWSEYRVPPLSGFIRHDAGHRGSIPIDSLGLRAALGTTGFFRVTSPKPISYARENARVTFHLSVFESTVFCYLALVGLVGL
jgi:hypothetical protein